MTRPILGAMMAAALAAQVQAADVYDLDAAHTTIGFSVRHMVVSSTKGSFGSFSGSFEVDPADPTTLKASAKVDVKSIDTKNKDRDDHLRGPDFFDAAKYPEITFESTKVEKTGDGIVLSGKLTMKGVTKEIAIPVDISGPVLNPWGKTVMGFEGSARINRKDWGITWNKVLDNGGVAVGDEVKLEISVEGIKRG
jgi:polyisoprenoid-binding protein YceI